MRSPWHSLLALILILAVAALAGCGGSSTSPRSSSSAGSAPSGGGQVEEGGAEVGGEKSIEEFGEEAAGSERTALLAAFTSYLKAIATKDYVAACPHLAATVQRSLERFVPPKLRAGGCAAILPRLLAPTAPAIAREQAAGRITKVRVKGSQAFIVFHAPGAKLFMMTMVRAAGEWKVGLVAASVLVPSAATLGQ